MLPIDIFFLLLLLFIIRGCCEEFLHSKSLKEHVKRDHENVAEVKILLVAKLHYNSLCLSIRASVRICGFCVWPIFFYHLKP